MIKAARCPKCRSNRSKKVIFTWWGLIFGGGILAHKKCKYCGTEYNGKTGEPITTETKFIIFIFVICALLILLIVPRRIGRQSLWERISSWWR